MMDSVLKVVFYLTAMFLTGFSIERAASGEAVRLYDFGADEMAYLALPAEAPKASILLIPDALGVPEVVAQRCDLLAKLGYIAMTVDFYNGQTATTRDQAKVIQGRLSPDSARKTVSAALHMLTQSPQYRTDRIVVAVWGANMEFFRDSWQESQTAGRKISLIALTWMEPDGAVSGDPFAGLPRPLKVLTNNGPWMGEVEKAQAAQPLKRIPADIHSYNAKPGFLLQSQTDELGTQAWVSVIEFWKQASSQAPATDQEDKARSQETAKPEVAPEPQEGSTKKSSILPRR
jgi:hypothetical protein